MAFYRHFVERDDFDLLVATDDENVVDFNPPYEVLLFKQPPLLERLLRTRFCRFAHSYKHLWAGNFISPEVLNAAIKFKPDLIFTIAGSWSWTALMAKNLARKIRVPLVASFNDWFDFSSIIHPLAHPLLEWKFRAFYRACDLAWCTSEGMRDELGPHPNAQILYPIGAPIRPASAKAILPRNGKARFVVAFAGNLGNWYGRMLEQLVTASAAHPEIEFRIFGGNPSWSGEFDKWAKGEGIFRGHLPFNQLRDEMATVDAALLLMGFDQDCALTERTSFKTKFLDYLSFERPIVLWGPEYCSAVRYAREFDSAEMCLSADASECVKTVAALANNPRRQAMLGSNARRMYEDRFRPDKIHSHFLRHMRAAVTAFQTTP